MGYEDDLEIIAMTEADKKRVKWGFYRYLTTHRTESPIDHPNGCITPSKLKATNAPTDGKVPSYNAAADAFEWVTGGGGGGGPDWMQYYRSGRWYYGIPIIGSTATTSMPANRLFVFPFFTPVQSSWDAIGIYVSTAATGYARMGVYADNGNVYPGNLILDAGEVDTGTTGVKTLSITLTLSPGLYWLALLTSAAPVLRGIIGTYLYGCLGAGEPGSQTQNGYYVTYTYGPLPTQFPSGAAAAIHNYLLALRKA